MYFYSACGETVSIDAPRAPGDRSNCHRHQPRASAARAPARLRADRQRNATTVDSSITTTRPARYSNVAESTPTLPHSVQ